MLLKSVMAPIGIDIALQKMPVAAHSDQVQSKNADFALWIDFPIQPDPNYSLGLMYGSGNAVNYQNYSNAEVDRILKEGTSIVDGAKRNEFHAPAEDQISKDADDRMDRGTLLRQCDDCQALRLEVVYHAILQGLGNAGRRLSRIVPEPLIPTA